MPEFELSQQTEEEIAEFVDEWFSIAPEIMGISETIAGCEVTNVDTYGVGVAVFPRYVTARVYEYTVPILYRGFPTILVNDLVTVLHFREGNRYEVIAISGNTGSSPTVTGIGAAGQVTYWQAAYILAGDAGLTYNAFTNTISLAGGLTMTGGAAAVVTVNDNVANALTLVDAGALEYLRIITTNAQPVVVFNNAEVDVDFRVAANGVTNALFVDGANGYVNVNTTDSGAQVDIDQPDNAAAIPVLKLDQADLSEQCIIFSSDAVDRDINLYTIDVTGAPTMWWDEDQDALTWTACFNIEGYNGNQILLDVDATTSHIRGITLNPRCTSAVTTSAGLSIAPDMQPGGNVATSFGQLNTSQLSNSASNVVTMRNVVYRLSTAASYTGILTNVHILRIADSVFLGSQAANVYGLYLENINSGSAVNWAIYSLGGTSYFADNAGFGTTTVTNAQVEILEATLPQFRLTHTAGVDFTDFFTDANGDLYITPSGSDVWIGTEDLGAMIVRIAGDATGSNEGGELQLFTAADFDGVINYYAIDAWQDDFRIYTSNGIVPFTIAAGSVTNMMRLDGIGVGVGTIGIAAKLHVDQASTTAAIPVMTLDQADVSEEYINFIAAATGAGNPIDTATAVGAPYARVRVAVNGTFKYIQLYDA